MAQLPQQVKVLHVSCTDLNHIHILEKGQIVDVHQLRHNGQAGLLPGNLQKLQTLGLESCKVIGRGAGLEGSASHQFCTRRLDRLCHRHNLLFGFHRAGPCNHHEVACTDFHVANFHHHGFGVKLPVAHLEGLRHTLNAVNNLQALHQVHVHCRGVTHKAQHGLKFTVGYMDSQPQCLQPGNQLCFLLFGYTVL